MPLSPTISCGVNPNLNVDLSVSAGESVATQLALTVGGSPLNLTGYSAKMEIDFPTPLLLTSTDGGITFTDAANGTIRINIADTVTEASPIGSFPYDLFILSPGETTVIRVIAGLFTVLQSVTGIP